MCPLLLVVALRDSRTEWLLGDCVCMPRWRPWGGGGEKGVPGGERLAQGAPTGGLCAPASPSFLPTTDPKHPLLGQGGVRLL